MKYWCCCLFAAKAANALFVSPKINTASGLTFLKIASVLLTILPIVSTAFFPAASK